MKNDIDNLREYLLKCISALSKYAIYNRFDLCRDELNEALYILDKIEEEIEKGIK